MDKQLEHFYNQSCDSFSFVLNDNELHLFKNSRYIVKRICELENAPNYIAVMLHDLDFDDEIQQYETPHYQCIAVFPSRVKFKTFINMFINTFHCKENQISVKKASSVCMMSRYLCHLDDFDKHRYEISDVATNNVDLFYKYCHCKVIKSFEDLINAVKENHYDLESIMLNVGNYNKWRVHIKDLIADYRLRGRF